MLKYKTSHYTIIRDWRLGLLHKTFLLLIFLYIVVWSIVLQKGYLEKQAPLGVVRLSIRRPVTDPYCKPPWCINNFVPPNKLKYCSESLEVSNCQYWDAKDVALFQESSLFITTRVTEFNETLNCSRVDDPTCQYYLNGSIEKYFIGDIDSFTLRISHSVRTPSLPISANAKDLRGSLMTCSKYESAPTCANPSTCTNWTVFESFDKDSQDTFELSHLLKAARVDLDDASCLDQTSSKRNEGLVLILLIDYDNVKTDDGEIIYEYKLLELQMKYKIEEPRYISNIERATYNRHGVRLVVLQSGELGAFTFNALLIQLTSSLTLFAIATVIVDSFALYVLPEKSHYLKFMNTSTPTFSKIRSHTVSIPDPNEIQDHNPFLDPNQESSSNSMYQVSSETNLIDNSVTSEKYRYNDDA